MEEKKRREKERRREGPLAPHTNRGAISHIAESFFNSIDEWNASREEW